MFADYGTQIEIHRDAIIDDAMKNIYEKGINMQRNLNIHFVDEHENVEDGYGPGLLKEFLTKLTAEIFDLNRAYFSESSPQQLYPNVNSRFIDPEW